MAACDFSLAANSLSAPVRGGVLGSRIGELAICYLALSSQKATALAAATLRLSTPWAMGIRTV